MVVTLSDMVGFFPRKNLICPKLSCGRLVSLLSQVKIHPTLPWCRAITCDLCYHQWFICVNCCSGGGGRLYKKVLKVHEKSAGHRRMLDNIPDDPTTKEDEVFQYIFDDLIHEEFNDSSTLNELGYTTHPSHFKFQSDQSANYFRHHAKNKNGPSYLVSKSIFGSIHATETINFQQVFYHIFITLFLLTLTTNQQEMFASIMEFTLVLNEKASQQSLLNTTAPLSQTSPPSSMQDFRNHYLRDPQSIVSNVACTEIHFRHGHAYNSVRDCIASLLANGREVNAFNSGMKLQSEVMGDDAMVKSEYLNMRQMMIRAQAKYPNESVLCLPLYGWGDNYDPAASIKGGRAPCHCKSVPVSPPHGNHNSLDNTFIIALSRKNNSHEDMEAEYRK
jgi:hypothetical protein